MKEDNTHRTYEVLSNTYYSEIVGMVVKGRSHPKYSALIQVDGSEFPDEQKFTSGFLYNFTPDELKEFG